MAAQGRSMGLTVQVEGLDELIADFDDADRALGRSTLYDAIAAGMVEAGLFIERQARQLAPVGVSGAGGLRGSLVTDYSGRGLGTVVEVGTPVEYAAPVELGIRPGEANAPVSAPDDPVPSALVLWAMRKVGMNRVDATHFAMVIRRKVLAQPKPFLGPAVDDNEEAITAILEKALDRGMQQLRGTGSAA